MIKLYRTTNKQQHQRFNNNITIMSFSTNDNMLSVSTMSNSASTTPSRPDVRQVPSDLIPTSRRKITFEYAQETKNWACMFDRQQFQALCNNENDPDLVKKWQNYMMNMQSELRTLGHEHACKEIVTLFVTQYEIRNPVTNIFPKTYDDVIKIIESPLWYNKNIMKSRNIIWMVTYGLFRRNMDRWLQNVAHDWKESRNIREIRRTQQRTGNGFVQQNLLQNASTLIQRRIKTIMWSRHNEVLCCKRKCERERMTLCEKLITCSGYDVYLYTPVSTDYAHQQIRQSVMHALQLRIQQNTIVQTVRHAIVDYDKHNTNANTTGEFYCVLF